MADAFDAMTTDRVYRPAQPVEQAVETLRTERERQFDPAAVDAFLASLEQALEIRERFAAAAGALSGGGRAASRTTRR